MVSEEVLVTIKKARVKPPGVIPLSKLSVFGERVIGFGSGAGLIPIDEVLDTVSIIAIGVRSIVVNLVIQSNLICEMESLLMVTLEANLSGNTSSVSLLRPA